MVTCLVAKEYGPVMSKKKNQIIFFKLIFCFHRSGVTCLVAKGYGPVI